MFPPFKRSRKVPFLPILFSLHISSDKAGGYFFPYTANGNYKFKKIGQKNNDKLNDNQKLPFLLHFGYVTSKDSGRPKIIKIYKFNVIYVIPWIQTEA